MIPKHPGASGTLSLSLHGVQAEEFWRRTSQFGGLGYSHISPSQGGKMSFRQFHLFYHIIIEPKDRKGESGLPLPTYPLSDSSDMAQDWFLGEVDK